MNKDEERSRSRATSSDRRHSSWKFRQVKQQVIWNGLYQPDEKKNGGAYVTVTGSVKKIDAVENTLLMRDGYPLPE